MNLIINHAIPSNLYEHSYLQLLINKNIQVKTSYNLQLYFFEITPCYLFQTVVILYESTYIKTK